MFVDLYQNVIFFLEEILEDVVDVKGFDFNKLIDLEVLLKSYEMIGFQVMGLVRVIWVVDEMVSFDVYFLGVIDGGLLEWNRENVVLIWMNCLFFLLVIFLILFYQVFVKFLSFLFNISLWIVL